jgi:hypothetical protein
MKRKDFSDATLNEFTYGGSERKIAVILDGEPYMLKFRKRNVYGSCFNDVAEYLASHIFSLLGVKSQDTDLGQYKGECVVACKDFRIGSSFVPFSSVGESSLEEGSNRNGYSYSDIETLIFKNLKLADKEAAVSLFWETYVIDALLANPDRHGHNWGYLKDHDTYRVAPIFDNGSSLFSSFSSLEEMSYVLTDQKEIDERVYETPVSLINQGKTVSSYYDVLVKGNYPRLAKALKKIFPRINLEEIYALIDSVEDLEPIRKQFLKRIITERYHKILKVAYLRKDLSK